MPDSTAASQARSKLSPRTTIDPANAATMPREQFLTHLLASICDTAPARGGAILRLEQADAVQMQAVYPPLKEENVAPAWLGQAADHVPTVAETGVSQLAAVTRGDELYGQSPNDYLAIIPLSAPTQKPEVAVMLFNAADPEEAARARGRLELMVKLSGVYDMQQALRARSVNLLRMRTAMEIVGQLTEHQRFRPAAMALCNEVAAKWSAERVSLGVLVGRYVKIKAISHTDRFTRKMRLVQDLESAMEECLDQDVEVIHPAPEDATFVSRAAEQSATRHGPVAMLNIPLRRDGEVKGVLTIERDPHKPFNRDEIETLRLLGDLCAGSILYLFEHDRWTGAKVAADLRHGLAALVGPRHTWLKLTIVGVLAAVLLTSMLHGDYRVEAPFVVEPPQLNVVSAPFSGRLLEVYVEPDDVVKKDAPLAAFDTTELQGQLASEQATRSTHTHEENKAQEENDPSGAKVAVSQRQEVEARIKLLDDQIERALIKAPRAGRVLSGDLKRHINRPYEHGETLFEIAPVNEVHAELSVPENRIGDLLIEQKRREKAGDFKPLTGELAATANPGDYIPFEIKRIDPMAEVDQQRTVFRVHVKLLPNDPEQYKRLKRGMTGTAKIEIDQRPYIEIWTKDVIGWVRMKLWI